MHVEPASKSIAIIIISIIVRNGDNIKRIIIKESIIKTDRVFASAFYRFLKRRACAQYSRGGTFCNGTSPVDPLNICSQEKAAVLRAALRAAGYGVRRINSNARPVMR